MPQGKGRVGHSYEIRIEQVGEFVPRYCQSWGAGSDLPEEWDQFQQEHIGDPGIHAAQIYRASECRKSMDKRTVLDEYASRDINKARWQK